MDTRWHTNETRLWTRSTAEDLFKVMHIDPVRDEIMYWLTPKDAIHFVVGSGIIFSKEDMIRYTSLFKYIIPDRRWLMNKIRDGYTFTAIGTTLHATMDYNIGSNENRVVHRSSFGTLYQLYIIHITLIVTKDEHFVPCTEEFLPMHAFMKSSNHEHMRGNTVTDSTETTTRYLQTTWNGIKIEIACPLSNQLTSEPLVINDKMCHLAPEEAYRKGTRRIYTTNYSHVVSNEHTIMKRIEPVLSIWHQPRSKEGVLFEVEIKVPSNKGMKMMVYTVHKSRTESEVSTST
ncbi:hypothetical protein LTS12_026773 [Elasticomyces elasticus]|nr:hypothetical protein LTS12_026773 [Elasticomyces elasticus]